MEEAECGFVGVEKPGKTVDLKKFYEHLSCSIKFLFPLQKIFYFWPRIAMYMLNILLTHSYLLHLDPKQEQWDRPYPPLMTLLAAAVLRQEGHSVFFHDMMFAKGPENIQPLLESRHWDLVVVFDDGFNYLTKMCLSNMRKAAWQIAQYSKHLGYPIAICSSDATDHFNDYLQNGFDYVMIGESEQTLLELSSVIEKKGCLDQVAGLVYREGEALKINRKRPIMHELDKLPLPAWDLIDLEPYRRRWKSRWGYFSINIATTRGCPYKCNWCAKPIYGNAYNMRSPQNVIHEIDYLQQLTSFDHIWFCDDIFGLKRSWVMEFADCAVQKGLHLRYKIQSRADLLVQDKYISSLQQSGCEEVWMGVESGAQEILDAMDKNITLEQVRLATQKLKQAGIKPCFFIQFGYLGETARHIRQTIDLITELQPHDIGISISYPLPGTYFYEKVKHDLVTKSNWADSNDLDMMFRNTYSPAFYRKLHRYVHHQFRKQKAWTLLRIALETPWQLNFSDLKKGLSAAYYFITTQVTKQQLKRLEHEAASSL